MNPGTSSQKAMERAMVIVLTLILIGILGTYIYFGMKQAKQPVVSEEVPVAEMVDTTQNNESPESDLGVNPMDSVSTQSKEERIDIMQQLDEKPVSESEIGGETIAVPAAAPATAPVTTQTQTDERMRILQQLEELE